MRWGVAEDQSVFDHAAGFFEQGGVFGIEGEEGLAGADVVAEPGVGFEAGVGADGVPGFGAASAETLHGPAYLLAVHRGQVARARSGEDEARGGAVERCGVSQDGGVAVVG